MNDGIRGDVIPNISTFNAINMLIENDKTDSCNKKLSLPLGDKTADTSRYKKCKILNNVDNLMFCAFKTI